MIDALQVQKNICGRLLCKISDFWKIIARTGFIVCTSWPNFHLLVYILSRMAFLRKVHFWGSIKTVALHSWVIDWPMAIHSQGGQWQQRGWVRSAPGRTPPSAPAFCVFPSLWLQQGLCFGPHAACWPTADRWWRFTHSMRTSSGTVRTLGMSSSYIEQLNGTSLLVRAWQNVVHWRREWQSILVFLPREPHGQDEKATWYDTERWITRVSRHPIS